MRKISIVIKKESLHLIPLIMSYDIVSRVTIGKEDNEGDVCISVFFYKKATITEMCLMYMNCGWMDRDYLETK